VGEERRTHLPDGFSADVIYACCVVEYGFGVVVWEVGAVVVGGVDAFCVVGEEAEGGREVGVGVGIGAGVLKIG